MKIKKKGFLISQLLKRTPVAISTVAHTFFPFAEEAISYPKIQFFLSSIPPKIRFLESKPPPSLCALPLTTPGHFLRISLRPLLSVSTSKSSCCPLTLPSPAQSRVPLPRVAGPPRCPQAASGIFSSVLGGRRQADGRSDGDRDSETQDVQKHPL